jgi:hypothetical protein
MMKITVEITKDIFPCMGDTDAIRTNVLVDGKPDIALARIWTRD